MTLMAFVFLKNEAPKKMLQGPLVCLARPGRYPMHRTLHAQ